MGRYNQDPKTINPGKVHKGKTAGKYGQPRAAQVDVPWHLELECAKCEWWTLRGVEGQKCPRCGAETKESEKTCK